MTSSLTHELFTAIFARQVNELMPLSSWYRLTQVVPDKGS